MRLIDPPDGRPWALLVLCGASLLLNVVLLANEVLEDEGVREERVVQSPDEPVPAAVAVADEPEEPAAEPEVPEGMQVVSAEVTHSLARTFQTATPEHADVVSAVYARLFFWDLDLRRDLQKGDMVSVAYEWDGELAHIPVATYTSRKLDKTLAAYRFQATGDAFPSWWDAEGNEVGRRLSVGPLHDYEQVTSLLKDRPRHKGMDFKTPVGTQVVAPSAGTVQRVDWNVAFNGNCVEMKYGDGTIARFLHLSETSVRAGQRLRAGQQLGLSGNTGRSTAPHLHYELEKAGRVVDPVDYHGVVRRALPASDHAAFAAEVARLDRILAGDS